MEKQKYHVLPDGEKTFAVVKKSNDHSNKPYWVCDNDQTDSGLTLEEANSLAQLKNNKKC